MNQQFWKAIDRLVSDCPVIIDRPKGSPHPRYSHILYPLDYGYLANTTSMDGSGIDLWRGTSDSGLVDAVICTIDLLKKDSEIKFLLSCTDTEKESILAFHNDSEFMKGLLIKR